MRSPIRYPPPPPSHLTPGQVRKQTLQLPSDLPHPPRNTMRNNYANLNKRPLCARAQRQSALNGDGVGGYLPCGAATHHHRYALSFISTTFAGAHTHTRSSAEHRTRVHTWAWATRRQTTTTSPPPLHRATDIVYTFSGYNYNRTHSGSRVHTLRGYQPTHICTEHMRARVHKGDHNKTHKHLTPLQKRVGRERASSSCESGGGRGRVVSGCEWRRRRSGIMLANNGPPPNPVGLVFS